MRKTLLFGTGAAIGFLMGARAGRPTYDSIMQNLQSLTHRSAGGSGGGGMSPTSLDLTDSGLGRTSEAADRLGRSSESLDRASAADWLGTDDAMPSGDRTAAPVAGTQEHFGSPRPGL